MTGNSLPLPGKSIVPPQAVPVTIYPDLHLLTTSSNPKNTSIGIDNSIVKTSNANLVVGRRNGQTSPDLRWLATDGSFAAFDLFAKIDRMVRHEGGERDFGKILRRVSASDGINGKPLTWNWGPVDFKSGFIPLNYLFTNSQPLRQPKPKTKGQDPG